MTADLVTARLAEDARLVESALDARVRTVSGLLPLAEDSALALLHEAQDYSLRAGGKRIRPALVLEACRALGGNVNAVLPLACAIEMIHTYSLIHDDLPCMDNDDMRRGKPTSHKAFGEANAILAGDSLLTDAFLVAASADLSDAAARAALTLLSEAAGSVGMVGGQMMDLAGETRRLTEEELKALHARKTGALIRAAVGLGAIGAGYTDPDHPARRALDRYAADIGLAFQVVDDVLDVIADPTLLGKSCGKDAAENKTTFLTYYSVEEAKAYAHTLSERACETVADFDPEGFLAGLSRLLADRVF